MAGATLSRESQRKVADAKVKHALFLKSQPRYSRRGECIHCGWCCLCEDPSCPHLKMSEGKSHCTVYGKPERFKRCKLFPEYPPIKHEGCGFRFYDNWEKKTLGVHEV